MIDLGELVVIDVVDRRGWRLNMSLVRLPSGGVLVHSPTFGDDGTFARIEQVGRPEVLFAPNHFHHLSLPKFRARYPDARAVCSDGARPRLTRKGHTGLGGLGDVRLAQGGQWIELPQAKNGEAWISLAGDGGPTWVVCDGFFNMAGAQVPPGLIGFLLRRLDVVPGLKLGRTFKWLLRDKRAYRAWLLDKLRSERPRRVVFSHGDPLVEDATERLIAATEAAIPT
jgi:hypothetical protein